MGRPEPQHFGLPADFEAALFERKTKAAERKKMSLAVMIGGVAGFIFYASPLGGELFPAVIVAGIIYVVSGLLVGWILRPRDFDQATAYLRELAQWKEFELETGRGYWRRLRGVEFENSLQRMLHKRGCLVHTTRMTGDGGIDLIVRLGDREYWCQCKGHEKPISVGPIREIAGVCSRSNAIPVVFAVNGYTQPAIETAQALGVMLFNTYQIVALAERDCISEI